MKIEKINDNQIRCTLTREDLADRHMRLSELAYGTDKAKTLFREMIQRAFYEYGFEAEDIPLMVEAVPLSSDSILLIITKVECPEELDTRFSQFSQSGCGTTSRNDTADIPYEALGADDVLEFFRRVREEHRHFQGDTDSCDNSDSPVSSDSCSDSCSNPDSSDSTDSAGGTDSSDSFSARKQQTGEAPSRKVGRRLPSQEQSRDSKAAAVDPASSREEEFDFSELDGLVDVTRLYVFQSLREVQRLSRVLHGFYDGENSLYKNNAEQLYFLVIHQSGHSPLDYNKICNIISEYGRCGKYSAATEAYLAEHYETILAGNALQVLGAL